LLASIIQLTTCNKYAATYRNTSDNSGCCFYKVKYLPMPPFFCCCNYAFTYTATERQRSKLKRFICTATEQQRSKLRRFICNSLYWRRLMSI